MKNLGKVCMFLCSCRVDSVSKILFLDHSLGIGINTEITRHLDDWWVLVMDCPFL